MHRVCLSAETELRARLAAGPVLQTNANAPPAPRRAATARPQPAAVNRVAFDQRVAAFEQAFAPRAFGVVAALAALFQYVSLWTALALWVLALGVAWRQSRHAAAPPAVRRSSQAGGRPPGRCIPGKDQIEIVIGK